MAWLRKGLSISVADSVLLVVVVSHLSIVVVASKHKPMAPPPTARVWVKLLVQVGVRNDCTAKCSTNECTASAISDCAHDPTPALTT